MPRTNGSLARWLAVLPSCLAASQIVHTLKISFAHFGVIAKLPVEPHIILQWNLDLTKSLGTGQICSLNGGFVISRFFSIHFTVTLAGTGIEIISFVISRSSLNRGSLNRGSTVIINVSYSQIILAFFFLIRLELIPVSVA